MTLNTRTVTPITWNNDRYLEKNSEKQPALSSLHDAVLHDSLTHYSVALYSALQSALPQAQSSTIRSYMSVLTPKCFGSVLFMTNKSKHSWNEEGTASSRGVSSASSAFDSTFAFISSTSTAFSGLFDSCLFLGTGVKRPRISHQPRIRSKTTLLR